MKVRTAAGVNAAEVMKPVPDSIRVDVTAAQARRRMEELDLSFIVVVAPGTGKLLAVVLHAALMNACASIGHAPEDCPLTQHLKADIDFCHAEDGIAEIFAEPAAPEGELSMLQRRRRRARQRLPVVVVDDDKVPIGLLDREAGGTEPASRHSPEPEVFVHGGGSGWRCLGPASASSLLKRMESLGLDAVPVLDTEHRKPIGYLTRRTVDALSPPGGRRLSESEVRSALEPVESGGGPVADVEESRMILIIGAAYPGGRLDRRIRETITNEKGR